MRRLPVAILTLTMAASLAACGSSSSGGSAPKASTTPTASASSATVGNGVSDPTAATAQIKTLYATFFSAPVPQAKTLLQDGPYLSAAFKAAEALKGKATESAKVQTVQITSADTAKVTFDLYTGGNPKPVLTGSDGAAVFVNGQWKVAKQTFCGLVEIATPNVKGC